ncbi:MAG: hypothetical protein A3H13_00710 [Candidatus Taylorbacteria bacterium RIFCSPLOWO2_12_FULL_48_11]|nr:MAG: hypothetical protein A3H13_00710 [Candidatus Taylorbacteria bacterium RIFCSPLOWO2_12_FULL_48_11]
MILYMRTKHIFITAVVIGIALASAAFFFFGGEKQNAISSNAPSLPAAIATTYTHPTLNFSFEYPDSFTVSSFAIEGGEVTTVQEVNTQKGFQISITPIDEDLPALTVERIKQDLPNLLIESPQDIIVGERGRGVSFMSNDAAFDGKSREVWFVAGRHFYQLRTYARYDAILNATLSTWKFTNGIE